MKAQIKELISDEKYQEAYIQLETYQKEKPYDSEVYLLKSICSFALKNLEQARWEAKLAERNMPYVSDVHYNLGCIYQECKEWMKAYEQFSIAEQLANGGNTGSFNQEEIDVSKKYLLEKIADDLNQGSKQELIEKKHYLDYIISQEDLNWCIREPIFHDLDVKMIGKEYMDYAELEKLYLGISGLRSNVHYVTERMLCDTISETTEIQRVSEEKNQFIIDAETECYVPIIMNEQSALDFQINGKTTEVAYLSPLQYSNYRLPKGHAVITSSQIPFRIGKVVPIVHDKKRKRLVLNIFVDGLSETVLGKEFETLMPHTAHFFQKGVICERAYTTGDWTFPSVASIVTGQTLANHKMLHSKLLRKIDFDTPILYEYFKDAGYNTTKIGGNWRIAPNYGYARGMNRIYYQHMYEGYTAERVITEAEEQMHRMKETDQFIWLEIGELHTIADGVGMTPMQSEFMVWENGVLGEKINSVKQDYDQTKRKYYLKQVEYIDRRLASLYQYIEENYKEEEIIVSLFADHGQGYLVKQDESFLSDERIQIAFMFRGNGMQGKIQEPISSCDYSAIMCKMAGIDYKYNNTDAHLPMGFGGNEEREFTVTETIHVGDPYQIILNGKDFRFYLDGKENVTSECRVPLNEYTVRLTDRDGNEMQDEEKIKQYTEWCLKHIGSCVIYKD